MARLHYFLQEKIDSRYKNHKLKLHTCSRFSNIHCRHFCTEEFMSEYLFGYFVKSDQGFPDASKRSSRIVYTPARNRGVLLDAG